MKKIPATIKHKMRQIHKLAMRLGALDAQVCNWFEAQGVDTERLCAAKESCETEGLAFLRYAEGDVEEIIDLIEKAFLTIMNSERTEV